MTLLHTWFKARISWGTAEAGERCSGCRRVLTQNYNDRGFLQGERCLILRLAHAEYPDKWLTRPIETWCERCADLLYPKIYPGMEGYLRGDNSGEAGEAAVWDRWRWELV